MTTLATPKTLAEWRLKIFDSLGGTGWNVELDERTIDHAIYQTQILFNKYRPNFKFLPLGIVTTQNTVFNLKTQVDIGVNVVDVKFQHANLRYFSPFHRPFLAQFRGMREPRRLFKLAVADDQYEHFLGTAASWKWVAEEQKLVITAEATLIGINATALLLLPLLVEKISFSDEYDFLEGCVGYAKQILGRRLRKNGDIPSSQGNIHLDGNELVSEGNTMIVELTARLMRSLKGKPTLRSIY